ncbi:hypothetical protein SEA_HUMPTYDUMPTY_60 [Arthrobacter phage HumptyDumpty]|uniref:Uncharacterized protein n=3 Tax=Klausavirus princesstrina TaxID=1984784 RepID=A0A286N473_9CAUD|nr:hypothetical protein SEA_HUMPTYDUMPTY_60 [Arthrobacter phage HumptyDumpty]ASX99180.1 hypothetical protein SEA_TOPHAT_60 [Arthrobacter phage Tophat]QEQ94166.1 hypothetical protein SEA_MORDRED_60 [Arthrobacter phage Mordred]
MSKNLKPQQAPIEFKAAAPRIVIDPVEPSVILDLQQGGVFLKLDPEAARKLGMALASGAARAEGKTKGHVIMTFVEDEK